MNNTKAERLSFIELLKQHKINIPIIQRDYAQGRKSKKEVRETFLDALEKYLKEDKPNRDLDFVYGSLNDKDFIPLDGQQRLTTLFLLHWYLAQISNNMNKLREVLLDDGKSKFTYETRPSSSDFCKALMENDINFENLEKADKDLEKNDDANNLSKTIKNAPWYFLSWKYDPTIQAMLTMLDAIHKKFAGKGDYFDRLFENRIVTFWLLNLKDFKLTDDLYIKMNSRGKLLTPFENFKAKYEQYIDNYVDKENKTDRKFYLKFDGKDEEVSLKKYFSHNIDTKWADIFWKYRDLILKSNNIPENKLENNFDRELMNFIRVIFTNHYAMFNESDDNLEILLKTKSAKEKLEDISFFKYEELKALTCDGTLHLVDAFDCLEIDDFGKKEVKNHLSNLFSYYFDEKNVFKNALKHDFKDYSERVMFHAYIRFLIQNKKNWSGIDQWMRVIHNLANNTDIDEAKDVLGAIKSIVKMMPEIKLLENKNILDWLMTNPKIDFFSSWQVLEEKIKAHLITKNDNWKEKIESIEKHLCFDGQIGFILKFSGIVEYYEKHNNSCNWSEDEDKKFFDVFENYAAKAIAVFQNNNKYNSEYLWERAVLTKGDYLFGPDFGKKNLLTTSSYMRNYSWKRLLRIKDDKRDDYHVKSDFVKQVFDDDRFDFDIDKGNEKLATSLETICKDKTNTWRDYFISCPELMKYCSQGFILHEENRILLFKKTKGKNAEMYSYYLLKEHIEKESFHPFIAKYNENINIYVKDSCVVLEFYHKKHYQIEIYGCPDSFEVHFKESKGEKHLDHFGCDIKIILEELGWHPEESHYYSLDFKNINDLMNALKRLCERLNRLSE